MFTAGILKKRLGLILVKFLISAMVVMAPDAAAQSNQQVWTDFQLDYPFGGEFLAEGSVSYQTLLNKDQQWNALYVTPTFEYQRFRSADFLFNMPIGFVKQQPGYSSLEIDPSVGMRFRITQGKRVTINFITKFEERFFRAAETDSWSTSNRVRLKGEIYFCVNGPNLFTDHLLYLLMDYEEFVVTDHQLDERFANLRRARAGLGYRLSYVHRFELIYTRQSSRDEINDSFNPGDNILQVRYLLFLNPAKP